MEPYLAHWLELRGLPLTLRVLHLSDTHLGGQDALAGADEARLRLERVIARVLTVGRVDAVVVTGDLTDDGTLQATLNLAAALERFNACILAVPGNHDSKSSARTVFPGNRIDLGPWTILGLDTSKEGQSHGLINSLEFVEEIDGLRDRFVLLAMHHPPVSPACGRAFRLEGGEELLEVLKCRKHVRGILSGHLHLGFEIRLASGLVVLGAPSTLVGFDHSQDGSHVRNESTTGAREVLLHGDGTVSSRLLTV